MKRIIIAALVGGIVFFIWSAIAHMLLPLGTMGLKNLPNENVVVDALRENVKSSGMYFFPGMTNDRNAMAAAMSRGPSGLLIYTAGGVPMMDPMQLLSELVTNIIAAFFASVIVALVGGTQIRRTLVVAIMGAFGWVSLLLSYWIWYHYTTAYILGEGITEVVGWFLAGLVIAWIVPPRVVAAP
jgi:hypothetical protein